MFGPEWGAQAKLRPPRPVREMVAAMAKIPLRLPVDRGNGRPAQEAARRCSCVDIISAPRVNRDAAFALALVA